MRRGAKLGKAKVKAKPPVARKSLKSAESRVRDLEKRLAEALEQQTATSEILRVISSSRTDVQPVFETMAANALRLCNAASSAVFRFDGELIHLAALTHFSQESAAAVRRTFPMPAGRGSAAGRAILTRSIAQITDVRVDRDYVVQGAMQIEQIVSVLAVLVPKLCPIPADF